MDCMQALSGWKQEVQAPRPPQLHHAALLNENTETRHTLLPTGLRDTCLCLIAVYTVTIRLERMAVTRWQRPGSDMLLLLLLHLSLCHDLQLCH